MVRLDLTGIFCADETSYRDQLGFSGVYLTTDDKLVCLFCASDRAKAGEIGLRCVLDPGPGLKFAARRGGLPGEDDPLTERDSAALLVKHGAKIHGRYEDVRTGELADPDDVQRAFLAELAGEG